MSASHHTVQDLRNSIIQSEELTLTGEVIGQTNFELLALLFPRQKEFTVSNASLEADKSNESSLYFSAAFQNLNPWREVEANFCIFDHDWIGSRKSRH